MTRNEFKQLIQNNPVYLDGATGSNLQKRGMPKNVCPEKWILENREIMLGLQTEYVKAGSQIIYAPTFTANRIKLAEYGLSDQIVKINKELIAISKEAANGKAFVAGDLTMTGRQLKPMGDLNFEELITVYKEQIQILTEAGTDLLIIETMLSLQECRAAVIAAKEVCDLPIMVTLTFETDGRTLYGTTPEAAVVVLQNLGVDAVGVNCSAGPDKMIPLITSMKKYATIPIIAKPNAGLPSLDSAGNTVYDMDENTFVGYMKEILTAGANIIGGCCGTTPDYMAKLVKETATFPTLPALVEKKRCLSSEQKVLEIDLDGRFLIVGERINPTGKKKLQEELRNGSFELVIDFALQQKECGAGILDINVGMSGINEKDTMIRAMEEVTQRVDLPLCFDSSYVEVLEAVLRRYPGRALINSVSLEEEKITRLLPIVKKYGAAFILLPLSDKGLPESLEEKIQIIDTIQKKALEIGLTKEDIVVDGLVTTVGANKTAALETLRTISYCKNEIGLATIIGLSNISFGLPERSYVNTTFLTMAMQSGLTMAIANPSQDLLMNNVYAADLLLNKEGADISYINRIQTLKEKQGTVLETKAGNEKKEIAIEEKLFDCVLKGNKSGILEDVKICLSNGKTASWILDTVLIPAINKVGDLFDKQIYFLPQLIASAEAMKNAIEYLEPMLIASRNGEQKDTVVIATVEGDIHDIGKNLVALMLKNYGFHVIDMGKDVKKECIIDTAMKENAKVIALSALMTTTMQEMRHVIEYAKEMGLDAKIIIGGAVITQDYADEIGADGYSRDAADAVKLVKRLLGTE